MKHALSCLLMILVGVLCSCTCPFSKIHTQSLDYSADTVTMKGYLAYDKSIKDKRPGILVVHEWWGHNEYARKRARMLAKLGYTALAVDMYGDGKQADHPKDAGAFAGELMKNMDVAKARFLAAMETLKKDPTVDPDKIAAIGYCFGGGVVLNMAREGLDLKGVASFHGSLATQNPAKPGVVKAKVLVLHGADDKMITQEQIDTFMAEMTGAGVDFKFVSYPGTKHSFTNPAADEYAKKFFLPLAYNADSDKKSWEELKKFLDEIFLVKK